MKLRLLLNIFLIVLLIPFSSKASTGSSNPVIDSLEVVLKNYTGSDELKVDILNNLGYEYWVVNPTLSVMHGGNALELAQQINYREGEAKANRVIGVADWAMGNYEESLNKLFPGLKIYRELDDSLGTANMLMNIGLVYGDQLSYDQALEYYLKGEAIFKALEQSGRLATTYTKIGSCFTAQKKYGEAFRYLTLALNIHKKQRFRYGIAEASNRIGLLFKEKGEYENALGYLKSSLNISQLIKDVEGEAKCLENIGSVYLLQKNFQKAEEYLLKGLEVARQIQSKKWLKDIYMDLKDLYLQKNKPRQAIAYFEKYSAMKDSLFDEKKVMEIAAIRLKFEMDRQRKSIEMGKEQIRLLEQKSKNRQLWIFLISSLLILGGLLAYFIIKRQRDKIQQERKIQAEKDALNKSKEELSRAKLENARLREEELKQELESRNKELTSYTLNFIRKNELLEEIKEELKLIESSKNANTAEVRRLRQKISHNSNQDKDWEDFKFRFEKVHTDFFKNLIVRHSNLTSGDLRLAALIRLNLNLKESATMLGISPESVKTSRYRLRKKLNIDGEEGLVDYMIKISS